MKETEEINKEISEFNVPSKYEKRQKAEDKIRKDDDFIKELVIKSASKFVTAQIVKGFEDAEITVIDKKRSDKKAKKNKTRKKNKPVKRCNAPKSDGNTGKEGLVRLIWEVKLGRLHLSCDLIPNLQKRIGKQLEELKKKECLQPEELKKKLPNELNKIESKLTDDEKKLREIIDKRDDEKCEFVRRQGDYMITEVSLKLKRLGSFLGIAQYGMDSFTYEILRDALKFLDTHKIKCSYILFTVEGRKQPVRLRYKRGSNNELVFRKSLPTLKAHKIRGIIRLKKGEPCIIRLFKNVANWLLSVFNPATTVAVKSVHMTLETTIDKPSNDEKTKKTNNTENTENTDYTDNTNTTEKSE